MVKIADLPENNLFCPLPWLGAMVQPAGTFSSCCIQRDSETMRYSSMRGSSISKVRNNEYWNGVRKDLIDGKQHPSCGNCWHMEDNDLRSQRQGRIEEFNWMVPEIMQDLEINLDGTLADQSLRYFDVRQTNLCNMKCLMCGPNYSSLWNDDIRRSHGVKGKGAVIDADDVTAEPIFAEVEKNLDKIFMFYFAGGEPLISDTHWKILDRLVEEKRFDVRLSYNTNAMKLDYKKKDAIEYWKKFDSVYVGCSIDAIGPRAEMSRTGTVWSQVAKNYRRISDALPNSLSCNITTSILTIAGLADTIKWLQQFNYNSEEHNLLANNVVYGPECLSIKILPQQLKETIWKDIKDTLKNMKDKRAYPAIENELFREVDEYWVERQSFRFVHHMDWTSFIRGFDTISVLKAGAPELVDWYKANKAKGIAQGKFVEYQPTKAEVKSVEWK